MNPISFLGIDYQRGFQEADIPSITRAAYNKIILLTHPDKQAAKSLSPRHFTIRRNYYFRAQNCKELLEEERNFLANFKAYPTITELLKQDNPVLLHHNNGRPLPIFDTAVTTSEFVVCHACWAVILRKHVNRHMFTEHLHYCKFCHDDCEPLFEHLQNYHGDCDRCFEAMSVKELENHIRQHHPVFCKICTPNHQMEYYAFKNHLEQQHKYKAGISSCCNALQLQQNIMQLQSHLLQKHAWFECPLPECNRIILKEAVFDHVFGFDEDAHRVLPCEGCIQTEHELESFGTHLAEAHSFHCCGTSMQRSQLDYHRYFIHQWKQCPSCRTACENDVTLSEHACPILENERSNVQGSQTLKRKPSQEPRPTRKAAPRGERSTLKCKKCRQDKKKVESHVIIHEYN